MFYCDGVGEGDLCRDQSYYDKGNAIKGKSITVIGWGFEGSVRQVLCLMCTCSSDLRVQFE